jgi:transposase
MARGGVYLADKKANIIPNLPHRRRRIGHNLAIRMRDHKAAVLRFVHDLSVPFSNNMAEQAMRMMKVKAKISGCFRSLAGA